MKIRNFFGHLITITRHRHVVMGHCFRAGIFWRGCLHDLSKYSPTEFWPGVRYYLGNRSPNEGERAAQGYSLAWMHHKGRNQHHFEYWTDYDPKTHLVSPVKMPFLCVVEMFCDRVAASKIYQKKEYTDNSPLEYFLRAKPHRAVHPETAQLLELLLRILSEKGEKEVFAYLRRMKKQEARK